MSEPLPNSGPEASARGRQAIDAFPSVAADGIAPYLLLALLCAASFASRPLLPPDETRYLTVAWEMFQSGDWFVPTLNFAPYHHKPPLLFWLVDLSWTAFGVGRAQAMLVVFAVSSLVVWLMRRMGQALWPGREDIANRIAWLMVGSVPFVIYSSLILFDLLLTACVLASFLSMLAFARGRGIGWAVAAGLSIGLGVLAKGPVVLVHILWPFVLYPLWRTERETLSAAAFAWGTGLAVTAALLPVAIWLVPALLKTDGQFAHDLIWEQSAGRISGSMEASHPRPFYFYLLLLPVAGLPWILSPDLWRAHPGGRLARMIRAETDDARYLRLLVLWGLGIFISFSLISGKQPHYLVPMLALVMVGFARTMATVPLHRIRRGALVTVAILASAQAVASPFVLAPFDLAPVAAFVATHDKAPIGFVGKYQGELGFLSRRRQPIEIVAAGDAPSWLASHPGGYLVVANQLDVGPLRPEAMVLGYRGHQLAVFGPGGVRN